MPDDELDRMLDAALERYSKAEPLAGMSDRILFRVRSRNGSFRKGWLPAGMLAASVIAAFVAPQLSHAPTVANPAPPVIAHLQRPLRETTFVLRPVRRVTRHLETTKQPIFPLPTPMTVEEKSLIDLASQKPGIFPDLAKDPDPIVIAPVEMKPLEIELISNPNEESSTYVQSNDSAAGGDSSRE